MNTTTTTTTSTSLSINPSLSPPFLSPDTNSTSSSFPSSSRFASAGFPLLQSFGPKPITPICKRSDFFSFQGSNTPRRRKSFHLGASTNEKMTIAEDSLLQVVEEDEESPPESVLLDPENNSRPRRIALFVEPSPFAYVSGYKNRFQNFIKYLREMGDEVMVVTTHEGVPKEFYGAKLIGSRSFPCPWYQKVPLSLALSPRIISAVAEFKPDIIHASSPGIMVFGALAIAKLLSVPIVMSYHTHVPVYIPRYTFSWLVQPMWWVIKFLHRAADLTLVPSAAIARDLEVARVTAANKIRLWNKGVDSESFHPKFKSHEMRIRLSNGEPEKPLIVHVGRLGVEKSLDFLKSVMDRLPDARIAFIGDGPYSIQNVFHINQNTTPSFFLVGARAGGVPDIIPEDQDGKIGYLYTPGDLEDCLNKLKPLLYDRELRETMGEAARKEMEKYDWRAATKKIRNENYNAAIWFWRKKRAQLLRPFQWLAKRIFPSPEVNV
ncbi:Sulfoquinovosyl transferase sqd2 [Stylosanthes scabra]|uniref:Sulfoquinovosyl transferase sqd2 n=1 Tax=Stylosanthes scabra TaxID=79078 RepID=A0ABU6YVG1_9FABA|nr:Sulfoquinovosyl transferase sqd2 [Stylosanthes scabra]